MLLDNDLDIPSRGLSAVICTAEHATPKTQRYQRQLQLLPHDTRSPNSAGAGSPWVTALPPALPESDDLCWEQNQAASNPVLPSYQEG